MTILSTSIDTGASIALEIVSVGFWALLGLVILSRVIALLLRRRTREAKDVVRPVVDAASVQSTAYGWPSRDSVNAADPVSPNPEASDQEPR